MSVFNPDWSHIKTCPKSYGAPVNTENPCGCASATPVDATTGELKQMAVDGKGRPSVVKQLAKNEIDRRERS